MIKQLQPEKVLRICCPRCGELELKIYPWSTFALPPNTQIPICKKCINALAKENYKKNNKKS